MRVLHRILHRRFGQEFGPPLGDPPQLLWPDRAYGGIARGDTFRSRLGRLRAFLQMRWELG